MNKVLREQIVKHIFSNFRIIPSDFVNKDKTDSLINKKYLIKEELSFELEDGSFLKNKIWGCHFSADGQDLNILLGDCSQDRKVPEYALIIQLANQPIYGCYLILTDYVDDNLDSEALIAFSLDGKAWVECNTFLQATFLSGMEQLKNIGFAWSKITDYSFIHETLLAFIDFHNALFEVADEGTEDRL